MNKYFSRSFFALWLAIAGLFCPITAIFADALHHCTRGSDQCCMQDSDYFLHNLETCCVKPLNSGTYKRPDLTSYCCQHFSDPWHEFSQPHRDGCNLSGYFLT